MGQSLPTLQPDSVTITALTAAAICPSVSEPLVKSASGTPCGKLHVVSGGPEEPAVAAEEELAPPRDEAGAWLVAVPAEVAALLEGSARLDAGALDGMAAELPAPWDDAPPDMVEDAPAADDDAAVEEDACTSEDDVPAPPDDDDDVDDASSPVLHASTVNVRITTGRFLNMVTRSSTHWGAGPGAAPYANHHGPPACDAACARAPDGAVRAPWASAP